MCYRAFEQKTPAGISEEAGSTHVPQLRPRWVGVTVAGLAAAAFAAVLVLPSLRDASAEQRDAAPQPVASKVVQPVSFEKVSTQSSSSLPADDGVPTDMAASSMAAGHDCHHGM